MVYNTFIQYLPKQHYYEENPEVVILKVPHIPHLSSLSTSRYFLQETAQPCDQTSENIVQ